MGLPTPDLQQIFYSSTAEDGLQYLRELDALLGGKLGKSGVWSDRNSY
ncbi:hypothetical protein PL8927_50228 [Planktothrix serta PCC 8927]|uniref:Uncharacterized protein n=1 Tax=Planktothrix serta PCC 8927 TaxID=671068 RepID=A0A7Z9BRL8_9CYAN|nr:hypothetical protein PL8927_50228 [Planktothrix serta PCC 8927]